MCSSPNLDCRELTLDNGIRYLQITSTGLFNVNSAISHLQITQDVDPNAVESTLGNLVSGSQQSPQMAYLSILNGNIEVPSQNGVETEFVPAYRFEEAANVGSRSGGFGNAEIETAKKWSGLGMAAILLWIGSKINQGSGKKRTPHPHANVPRLNSRDYNRPYEYPHTKKESENLSDQQIDNSSAEQAVRSILTDHELIRRPSDYETWPVQREHRNDTESVRALTEVFQEVPREVFISLVSAIKRKQDSGVNEVFSEAYWWQRNNGVDGSVVVGSNRDHRYYLPGRAGIERFAKKFFKII